MVKVKIPQSTKPWITKGIKISCLNKRKLYLDCRNSTNVDSKNHYKTYCQVLSEVIKTAKNLYYNNLIAQADNKQNVTWNVINTLTNAKTTNNMDPPNINGNSFTSIANTFNTYFIPMADNLLANKFSRSDTTKTNDSMKYLKQNIKRCLSQKKTV